MISPRLPAINVPVVTDMFVSDPAMGSISLNYSVLISEMAHPTQMDLAVQMATGFACAAHWPRPEIRPD